MMLIDAILQRMLHADPYALLRGLYATVAAVAILSPLIVSLVMDLLSRTKKARARARRDGNAELQGKYEGVCAQLVEVMADNKSLAQENTRLVGLLREECVHGRDWTMRTRRELDARKAVGG